MDASFESLDSLVGADFSPKFVTPVKFVGGTLTAATYEPSLQVYSSITVSVVSDPLYENAQGDFLIYKVDDEQQRGTPGSIYVEAQNGAPSPGSGYFIPDYQDPNIPALPGDTDGAYITNSFFGDTPSYIQQGNYDFGRAIWSVAGFCPDGILVDASGDNGNNGANGGNYETMFILSSANIGSTNGLQLTFFRQGSFTGTLGGEVITSVPPPGSPAQTPTPTPTTSSGIAVLDTTTSQSVSPVTTPYSGPVTGLQNEYINVTADSLNVTATSDNWFIHTGFGEDAITLRGGTNVADGGTGSNFLVSGTGTDTFFVDDRNAAQDIWSTVANFHSGDAATIWGLTSNGFDIGWVDGQGAAGYTGLTLHASASGKPTASLTLSGWTAADLHNGRLSIVFGYDGASGSNYLYLHANA